MLLGSIAATFLVLILHHGEAFNAMRPLRVPSAFQLHMGGGRSPAEKGMSKKQMFRAVRDKVFEAAKVPGFFDVGEGPPVSSHFEVPTFRMHSNKILQYHS